MEGVESIVPTKHPIRSGQPVSRDKTCPTTKAGNIPHKMASTRKNKFQSGKVYGLSITLSHKSQAYHVAVPDGPEARFS